MIKNDVQSITKIHKSINESCLKSQISLKNDILVKNNKVKS